VAADSRFQPSEVFGAQVYQAAADQGVVQAIQVVLGDGAAWISSLTDMYLPQAERRLDLWHLLRRAREAVAAEVGDEAVDTTLRNDLDIHLRRGAAADGEQLVQQHLTGGVSQAFGGYLRNQRA
jgi:hypothetical protein